MDDAHNMDDANAIRNCDLYTSAAEIIRAWLEDEDNWDDFGSPVHDFPEWIFLPAKGKEK